MEWYDYITLAAIVLIIGVPRFIFLKRLRHKRSTDRSKYNSSSYKKTTNAISALGAIVDEAKASREAQERETGEKQFDEKSYVGAAGNSGWYWIPAVAHFG